jgi:hypothetical protein
MFAMTLRFAEAGSVEIRVMVAGIGAMAPMGHQGMKH